MWLGAIPEGSFVIVQGKNETVADVTNRNCWFLIKFNS